MARTLDKEVVTAIERAIIAAQKAGRNPDLHAIAAVFSCTYQSVCYIRRRIEKHQRTGMDDRKKAGRKPSADHDKIAAAVSGLLARRPGLDQSAISDYISDEFGVRMCQASVSRMLKKNAIPHKVSNRLYKKSKLVTASESGLMTEQSSMKAKPSAPSTCSTGSCETRESLHDSANVVHEDVFLGSLMVTPSASITSNCTISVSDKTYMKQTAGTGSITEYSSPYS